MLNIAQHPFQSLCSASNTSKTKPPEPIMDHSNIEHSSAMNCIAPNLNIPKPNRPFFSSGPCVKPKEWQWNSLESALLGRSHRSVQGVFALEQVTESLRELLNIPKTHRIGLTPGSATGAIEMALWNFLRPETTVDILEWDVFSSAWAYSIEKELRLPVRRITGAVPEVFHRLNPYHDWVLTWCGTTHGVWVGEDTSFLDQHSKGEGLVIADAASAVFTTNLPWEKLDITTFSWQKGLGGEAGLGVIVLGPKAIERLKKYTPAWPISRLLRLKDERGAISESIFQGEMIHTCSMLLVQEYAALLNLWHQRGGLSQAVASTDRNFQAIKKWCIGHSLLEFSVQDELCRAKGPVVLSIREKSFQDLDVSGQWKIVKKLGLFLSNNQAGFDLINHIRAFPALRIWCGPTVEIQDLERLFPWIDMGLQELFQRF